MNKAWRWLMPAFCAVSLTLTGCAGASGQQDVTEETAAASAAVSEETEGKSVKVGNSTRLAPKKISADEFNSLLDTLGFWQDSELSADARQMKDTFEEQIAQDDNIIASDIRFWGDGLYIMYYQTQKTGSLNANEVAYNLFYNHTRNSSNVEYIDTAHCYASFRENDTNIVVIQAYNVVLCLCAPDEVCGLEDCETFMDYLVCNGDVPFVVRSAASPFSEIDFDDSEFRLADGGSNVLALGNTEIYIEPLDRELWVISDYRSTFHSSLIFHNKVEVDGKDYDIMTVYSDSLLDTDSSPQRIAAYFEYEGTEWVNDAAHAYRDGDTLIYAADKLLDDDSDEEDGWDSRTYQVNILEDIGEEHFLGVKIKVMPPYERQSDIYEMEELVRKCILPTE